ncbi:hypothetical protein D0469_01320 [Peribacillus saganii]|uniref:Uncharacterized protein n=1 Tax=Peribacillus saganii TaxID=2303992 RepID=A0A372LUB8_9BACI|nr:hypothetical protein [Peribacillus saganii]RFU71507.1 hypothetical protein D0469_01320 [Peribacillus saganii]
MNLDTIKKMLQDLIYFDDCEITHTCSKSTLPFSITVKKEKMQNYFLITFLKTEHTEFYTDVESAALTINKLIKN